jgi:Ca2+-binding RTX toxin-like protein
MEIPMTRPASRSRRALTVLATLSILAVSSAVAPAAAQAAPLPEQPPPGESWKEITDHIRRTDGGRRASESLTHPHPPLSTCSYDAAVQRVNVSVEGLAERIGDNTLRVGRTGGIRFAGSACEAATVQNTERIVVTGTSSEEDFIIDLRGGAFAPGATVEPLGLSEIEFSINLRGTDDGFGFLDTIGIVGGSGADRIVLGRGGMNLNHDADADVLVVNKPSTIPIVLARGGSDVIRARGGFGTGRAYRQMVIVGGGRGSDRIVGGIRLNMLLGGAGRDRLIGGPRWDLLIAGGGNDLVKGGGGGDLINGGTGNDRLIGGARSDILFGGRGRDVLKGSAGNDELAGGPGIDTCRPGPGRDELTSCER